MCLVFLFALRNLDRFVNHLHLQVGCQKQPGKCLPLQFLLGFGDRTRVREGGRERREGRELGNNLRNKKKMMRILNCWKREKNISRRKRLIMSDGTIEATMKTESKGV